MKTLDDVDSYDLPGVGTVVALEDARRVLHDLQAGYEQAEAGRLREIAYANAARKAERERVIARVSEFLKREVGPGASSTLGLDELFAELRSPE